MSWLDVDTKPWEKADAFLPGSNEASLKKISMPEESYGVCKKISHQPIVIAELANGYSIDCWDKSLGGQTSIGRED